MKYLVDGEVLKKVLLLIIENNHLSASGAGLQARAENRKAAINELLFILCLTKEEAEEIYRNSID